MIKKSKFLTYNLVRNYSYLGKTSSNLCICVAKLIVPSWDNVQRLEELVMGSKTWCGGKMKGFPSEAEKCLEANLLFFKGARPLF